MRKSIRTWARLSCEMIYRQFILVFRLLRTTAT